MHRPRSLGGGGRGAVAVVSEALCINSSSPPSHQLSSSRPPRSPFTTRPSRPLAGCLEQLTLRNTCTLASYSSSLRLHARPRRPQDPAVNPPRTSKRSPVSLTTLDLAEPSDPVPAAHRLLINQKVSFPLPAPTHISCIRCASPGDHHPHFEPTTAFVYCRS